MNPLSSLGAGLRRLDTAMQRTGTGRSLVRRERHRLRPGLYLRRGRLLWHRWGLPVPPTLQRSRGGRARRWWPDVGSTRSRAKVLLLRVLEVLTLRALPVLWVGRRRGDPAGFPIAVPSRDGGCVLLDPAGGRVARTSPDGPLPETQLDMRRRWQQHVSAPSFDTGEEGHLLLEEFVSGVPLHEVPPEQQDVAVRALFRSYTSLVAQEGQVGGQALPEVLTDGVLRDQLPAVLRDRLSHASDLVPRPWPIVPTATDTYSNNALWVHDRGVVFVDCFPLQWQPFFVVPVLTVIRWDRQIPELLANFLLGHFDRELEELFAAAQLSLEPTPPLRQSLLAVGLLASVLPEGGRQPAPDELQRAMARLEGRLSYHGLDVLSSWYPGGSPGNGTRL